MWLPAIDDVGGPHSLGQRPHTAVDLQGWDGAGVGQMCGCVEPEFGAVCYRVLLVALQQSSPHRKPTMLSETMLSILWDLVLRIMLHNTLSSPVLRPPLIATLNTTPTPLQVIQPLHGPSTKNPPITKLKSQNKTLLSFSKLTFGIMPPAMMPSSISSLHRRMSSCVYLVAGSSCGGPRKKRNECQLQPAVDGQSASGLAALRAPVPLQHSHPE